MYLAENLSDEYRPILSCIDSLAGQAARPANRGRRVRALAIFLFFVFASCILLLCVYRGQWAVGLRQTTFYGYSMLTFLVVKVSLALLYRPYQNEPPSRTVSVVIPSYNEAPEAALCIVTSILNQTYPIQELFFIDDGSPDPSAYNMICLYKKYLEDPTQTPKLRQRPAFHVHSMPRNMGKRSAQAYAFERMTGDLVLTVDSDGYLYPDALCELVRPFADARVVASTGHINARNRRANFFAGLLDMRYDNAFRIERGAQSVTGNVLCCSGPISCYRADIVRGMIQRYTEQTFLGRRVSVGDDRALTNYCIPHGKTVYQSTAQCDTNVPERYRVWVRQQIRWNRSFFRESLITLTYALRKPFSALWTLSELAVWGIFLYSIMANFILRIGDITWVDVLFLIAMISLSAYARNVFFAAKRLPMYLAAPVYGFLHFFTINLVRIYSFCTVRIDRWGTR